MAQLEREDDHEGAAQARLIGRLRKPNIQAFIANLAARWQRIENAAWQLYTERTVALAVGEQLNQIGKIVGYPRNSGDASGAESDDAVYRARVAAKILANRSGGTPADISAVFEALDLGVTYRYAPGYPAGFVWRVLEPIDAGTARLMLLFLGWSKPAGVKANLEWQEQPDDETFVTDNDTEGASSGMPAYEAGTGINGGTGAVTYVWPTHVAGHRGFCAIQTANEAVTLSTPSGMSLVASAGAGGAGGANANRITLFEALATSGAMADVIAADPGDHQIGHIYTFAGVREDEYAIESHVTAEGDGTAVTVPALETFGDDRLVVIFASHGIDSASAQFSGWTNADLASITEHSDAGATPNHGGGIAVVSGEAASAGPIGETTATLGSSARWAVIAVVLRPVATLTPGDGIGFSDDGTDGGALACVEEAL